MYDANGNVVPTETTTAASLPADETLVDNKDISLSFSHGLAFVWVARAIGAFVRAFRSRGCDVGVGSRSSYDMQSLLQVPGFVRWGVGGRTLQPANPAVATESYSTDPHAGSQTQ